MTYHHATMFPLAKDTTPYRKLTSEGVRMDSFAGNDILVVERRQSACSPSRR